MFDSGGKREEPSSMWELLLGSEVDKAAKGLDSPRGLMVGGCPERGGTACARLCLSVSEAGAQHVRCLGLPWASGDELGPAIHVP